MKLSLTLALFLGANALSHSATDLKEEVEAMEAEAEEDTEMWKVSMNNHKTNEVIREDKQIVRDMDHFQRNYPGLRQKMQDFQVEMKFQTEDIAYRMEGTAEMLSDPKYEVELNAMATQLREVSRKVDHNLELKGEKGLKMWSAHMDNTKQKELETKLEFSENNWLKFLERHPEVKAEMSDLARDIQHELKQIMQRMEKTARFMRHHYRQQFRYIMERLDHLAGKVDKNLRFDQGELVHGPPKLQSIEACHGEFIGNKREITGYMKEDLYNVPKCPGHPILKKHYQGPNAAPPSGHRAVFIDELLADPAFHNQVKFFLNDWDIVSVVNGWTEGSGYGGSAIIDCGARNLGWTLFVKHSCLPLQGIEE